MQGKLTIKFNDNKLGNDYNISQINGNNLIVTINSTNQMLTQEERDLLSLNLTQNIKNWTVDIFGNGTLNLNLTFFDPLMVSTNPNAFDKVIVLFKNQTLFRNRMNASLSTYMIERSIPR